MNYKTESDISIFSLTNGNLFCCLNKADKKTKKHENHQILFHSHLCKHCNDDKLRAIRFKNRQN